MRLALVTMSVLLALVAPALAGDAIGAHDPQLALKRMSPLTVRGTQFRAHERVLLVLHQPSGATRRHVTAGRHGRFHKAFTGLTVDRCRGYRVSAHGSAGSRATLARRPLPECPQA